MFPNMTLECFSHSRSGALGSRVGLGAFLAPSGGWGWVAGFLAQHWLERSSREQPKRSFAIACGRVPSAVL